MNLCNLQAVMDVKDFSPNDLQVRVVDDRVVVEGKYFKVTYHTTHIRKPF